MLKETEMQRFGLDTIEELSGFMENVIGPLCSCRLVTILIDNKPAECIIDTGSSETLLDGDFCWALTKSQARILEPSLQSLQVENGNKLRSSGEGKLFIKTEDQTFLSHIIIASLRLADGR